LVAWGLAFRKITPAAHERLSDAARFGYVVTREARCPNAEKQRWYEKHIGRRRDAQQIVNLLMRLRRSEAHPEIAIVRRALRGAPPKEMEAYHREHWKAERDAWLRKHPGRTAAEHRRLLRDDESEVRERRRAKGREYFCRCIDRRDARLGAGQLSVRPLPV
jgi:hypothetical protein